MPASVSTGKDVVGTSLLTDWLGQNKIPHPLSKLADMSGSPAEWSEMTSGEWILCAQVLTYHSFHWNYFLSCENCIQSNRDADSGEHAAEFWYFMKLSITNEIPPFQSIVGEGRNLRDRNLKTK